MLERLGRLCVGVGLLWVLLVVAVGLMGGLDKPELLAPFADDMLGADFRQGLYLGLTFVVVPIGMLMLLRDMIGDPEPLWLKLSAPGVFAAVYALFLAAAAPRVGQPLLLAVDPLVTQFLPAASLTPGPRRRPQLARAIRGRAGGHRGHSGDPGAGGGPPRRRPPATLSPS